MGMVIEAATMKLDLGSLPPESADSGGKHL